MRGHKRLLLSPFKHATEDSKSKALRLMERKKKNECALLDCGCGDGDLTARVAKLIETDNVVGVDIDSDSLKIAKRRRIQVCRIDLNLYLPFGSNSFDAVFAHQVIEHLYEPDNFVREIYRVLKPNGYAIVSTENLASWHNIFALFLGYQDFSTHASSDYRIGNPLSPNYMQSISPRLKRSIHKKILAYQSFKEIFEIHEFKVERVIGAGYYPFPKKLQSLFSSLDPRHAYFITVKARKPLE